MESIYGDSMGGTRPNFLDLDCDERHGTPSPEPSDGGDSGDSGKSNSDSDTDMDSGDEDGQETNEADDNSQLGSPPSSPVGNNESMSDETGKNGELPSPPTSPLTSQPPARTGLANSALVDLTEVEDDVEGYEEDEEQTGRDEVLDITQMLRTRNSVFEKRADNAIQQSSSESPSVDTFPPRRAYSERDASTLNLLAEARERLRSNSLFVTPGPLEEFSVSVSATPSSTGEHTASHSATPGSAKRVVIDLTMMDSDDDKECGTLGGGAGQVPKEEPIEVSPPRGSPRYETLSERNAHTAMRPSKRPASLTGSEPLESRKRQQTKFEL